VPRSRLERRLVAGALVLFLAPTLLAGAGFGFLYWRGNLDDPRTLTLAVAIGFVAMLAYVASMAHAIGRALAGSLEEIRRGTELIATVNPDYRLDVRTGDEMEDVAAEVNRMADRVREARQGQAAEVAHATRALQLERSKLAAVLADLDEAVVAAALDGTITLANRAAADALAGGDAVLGRNLYELTDEATLRHFLERLRADPGRVERFTLRPVSGAVLQAGLTAFVDAEGGLTGFILALRDVSGRARQEASGHGALAGATHALRGSLSSIRSLAESLLEPAPGPPGEDARLVAAIHAEAVRLSALVEELEREAGLALPRGASAAESIPVADLLRVGVGRLGAEAGPVQVEAVPAGLPPVRGEVAALSLALTDLLRLLLRRRQPGRRVRVRAGRIGGVVRLDLDAEGAAAPAELEADLDVPVSGLGPAGASVREVVQRHGGEVWAHPEPGRVALRLSLPAEPLGRVDPAPERPAPLPAAGLRSGVAEGRQPRPPLYDFTLLDQMARHLGPAARDARLDALTYAVIDVETTGLSARAGDRIVSVAAVRARDGRVRRAETFDALVNPGRPVPPQSARLHGITDAVAAAAPPPAAVLPAFWRFLEGAVLVGHEVWFDLDFLGREAERVGLPALPVGHAVLDTHLLSRAVHGETAEHSLEAVAGRLGVALEGRHSALGDALATAEILVRLFPLLARRGIVTLGDAVDAGRSAPGAPRPGPAAAPR